MSAFAAGLSASTVNLADIATILNSYLPVKVYTNSDTTLRSKATAAKAQMTGSNFSVTAVGDEAYILIGKIAVSASSVADGWLFQPALEGTAQSTSYFTAPGTRTDGKSLMIPVMAVWTDVTAGARTIDVDWSCEDDPPVGTVYARQAFFYLLEFKRR